MEQSGFPVTMSLSFPPPPVCFHGSVEEWPATGTPTSPILGFTKAHYPGSYISVFGGGGGFAGEPPVCLLGFYWEVLCIKFLDLHTCRAHYEGFSLILHWVSRSETHCAHYVGLPWSLVCIPVVPFMRGGGLPPSLHQVSGSTHLLCPS